LVPAERQENAEREIFPDVCDNAHQLRILSPPNETYPSKQSGIIETQGATFTDDEGNHRDDHNPNANKLCEIHDHVARNTTHVQLMLAILDRAWPPSILFRTQNPTASATASNPGTIAP
jgi:hypothetical protein